jgi:hypothetical protein
MNKEQYTKWRQDAASALQGVYSMQETEIILDWFDHIKGARECELVGPDVMGCLMTIAENDVNFDLHHNLMMRLWLYAPYILEEANK